MVDEVFQSENIITQVVDGLANDLQPTCDDIEDTIIQVENETSQSKKMSPELIQQMK